MDDDEVDLLAERVRSRERRVRRRATRLLANARTPAAIRALAVFAFSPAVQMTDRKVADIAESAITGLGEQSLVDAVCDAFLATGHPGLGGLIETAGYAHSHAPHRAVAYFLTGDVARYRSLDPTGAALREAHEHADGTVRGLVAERARAATSLEWVRAIVAGRPAARFDALTDPEWSALAEILDAAGQREFLWRLTYAAPPARAAQMIRLLDDAGWASDDPVERQAFAEVRALSRASRAPRRDGWVPADPTRLSGIRGEVRRLVVTPDGSWVCAGTDDGVRVWALPSGEAQDPIPREKADGRHLAVTPDGTSLVSDHGGHRSSDGLWNVASRWELASGKPPEPLGVVSGPVEAVSEMLVTPDGRFLAAGDRTGAIHLWALPSGALAQSLTGTREAVCCLAARTSGDEVLLASGHTQGTILLWQVRWLTGGRLVGRLDFGGMVGRVLLSEGGEVVAVGPGGGPVKVWDFRDRSSKPKTVGYVVGDVAATPDCAVLAGGARDGVQIWRSSAGTRELLLGPGAGATRLRVLANGRLLAAFDHQTGHGVRLWRLPSGRLEGILADEGREPTAHLSASADGGTIVTADSGGAVTLWRLWDERVRALGHLLPTDIEPADIRRLHERGATLLPGERAWLDLVSALVRRRDHPLTAAYDRRWDPTGGHDPDGH